MTTRTLATPALLRTLRGPQSKPRHDLERRASLRLAHAPMTVVARRQTSDPEVRAPPRTHNPKRSHKLARAETGRLETILAAMGRIHDIALQ